MTVLVTVAFPWHRGGQEKCTYAGGSFIGGHQKPKFHFRCRVVMFLCLGSFRELAHHYDNGWLHSYQQSFRRFKRQSVGEISQQQGGK